MQLQIEKLENLKVINFFIRLELTEPAVLMKPNCINIPKFVKNIFSECGGEYCLLTPDLIAFKYDNNTDIETASLIIMAELEDFFAAPENLRSIQKNDNILELAQAVADSFIRPTLNRDNGDVELLGLDSGILTLKFVGHCAGCPFAQNTLNNVIAKTFNRYVPQIKEIRLEE